MFIKRLLRGERPADDSFWKGYEAEVRAFSIDGKGERKPVFPAGAFVRFIAHAQEPWRYDLVLRSNSRKDDPYFFPLKADWRPTYELRAEDVRFTLRVQPDLSVELLFPVRREDYDATARFRQILGRLLYETEHCRSHRESPDVEKEVDARVKAEDPAAGQRGAVYQALLETLARLEKDERYLLGGIGRFSSLSPTDLAAEPTVVLEQAVLGVYKKAPFDYELRVLGSKDELQYHKEIGSGLHYYADEAKNSVTWVDIRAGSVVCLNFALGGGEVAALRRVITACVVESQKQMDIEEVIEEKKNDWDKFYLGERDPAEQLKAFEPPRNELGYAERPAAPTRVAAENDDIRGFAQGKAKNLCFVNRESGIEVFRFRRNSGDQLDLESAGKLNAGDVAPLGLLPLRQDVQLAALDGKQPNRAVLLDAESGKVVSEWRAGSSKLNDLAYFHGKRQVFGDASTFLALGEQDIYAVDPRTKEGVVQHRHYKSDYGFQKVVAAEEGKFVVSSKNGDLRLYASVGDKAAKNLIPAFASAEALGLDVTRDGTLVLVTYPKYLLLIITVQEGKSAFSHTFRKDAKPQPIVLTVAPEAMARQSISDIAFSSAKFDEKADADESFIVASANPFLVLWSLSKVLRGQSVSSTIKRMEDNVIRGEFKYNENDLLAAFKDHLYIQPTKEKD